MAPLLPLVKSNKERCRVCYTCVRECPAKAIRIYQGQADVITERCIGCGNCVLVCSQNAKEVLSGIPKVTELLASEDKIAAILAPSFPIAFPNVHYSFIIGALRKLGFNYVNEVALGADLVAKAYKKLLTDYPSQRFIGSTCPAIIAYIERYSPDLMPFLAPIVSPMIATGRALKAIHGNELKVVFIGPCIAKKGEMQKDPKATTDEVLTFNELIDLFELNHIDVLTASPSEFDAPDAGKGRLFPIARGLLEAAEISESLILGDIVATDGKKNAIDAIKEFETKALNAKLLEILCCNGGCIMGAGITKTLPLFQRRSLISQFARQQNEKPQLSEKNLEHSNILKTLDLSCSFQQMEQHNPLPNSEEIAFVLAKMGKLTVEDELNCEACGYETCKEHAIAILKGLAESEMCLPFTIERLRKTVKELANSNEQLASTQDALLQSEKLASMGQMAAGIAHEVNNPLGVVLMYANLLLEKYEANPALKEDLDMIVIQADRCKKILSGLLNFARQNKTIRQPTNLETLIHDSIKSAAIPDRISVCITVAEPIIVAVDKDQLMQALINLITNAIDAMPINGKLTIDGIAFSDKIHIVIQDTGIGIPEENLSKIFDPFFTTKQMGKGTGLGLSVTYGIIKMHQGDITVASNRDDKKGPIGTTFTINLPIGI